MIYINKFLEDKSTIENGKFYSESGEELTPITTTSKQLIDNRNKVFYKIIGDNVFVETLCNDAEHIYKYLTTELKGVL